MSLGEKDLVLGSLRRPYEDCQNVGEGELVQEGRSPQFLPCSPGNCGTIH